MKKVILLGSFLTLFMSCSNSETESQIAEIYDVKNEIDAIAQPYLDTSGKINAGWGKGLGTAMADAGGGLAAGTVAGAGGAIIGPYVILWSAFASSMTMYGWLNGYQVVNDPIYAQSPQTEFRYNEYGVYHNDLMYNAIKNNITIPVENFSISPELQSTLLSNKYFESGDLDQSFEVFQKSAPDLINKIDQFYIKNEISEREFLQNCKISTNGISTIESINNNIQKIDPKSHSSFLLEVDRFVEKSNTFAQSEKKNIQIYIAVLNSSIVFWEANSL